MSDDNYSFVCFIKAVAAAFIEIKTPRFSKKVQVDPYLEDALCSGCMVKQGPYFCRHLACFNYYCRSCWELQHLGPRFNKSVKYFIGLKALIDKNIFVPQMWPSISVFHYYKFCYGIKSKGNWWVMGIYFFF